MSRRPIPLSYAILAAIGDNGATTPELIEMLSRGQMYWTSSPSQIYAEPKRLLSLGLITGEKSPGRTRKRTLYRLTARGRDALCTWLRKPVGFPKIQHEAGLRLYAGDLLSDDEILASLRLLRRELEGMEAVIETNIARAPLFPHRTRYALLFQDLGRRLVQAHSEWLDAVERELS
jgi:DNA-binding PadR family transcriptional regulator